MLRKVITISLIVLLGLAAGPLFADGAPTYKAKCSMCHGPDGKGATPMGKNLKVRDLSSADVQKQTDIQLTQVIAGGKGKMPAYGKQLTTAEIQAVIAHIRTLKTK